MPKLNKNNDVEVRVGTSSDLSGIEKTQNALGGLASSVGSAAKTIGLVTAAAGTALVAMGVKAGSIGIDVAAQIQQAKSALTTFLGDTKEANRAINLFKEDAKKTPFDFQEIIKANQLLISTGAGVDESRRSILALGNAIVATGGGNEEFSRMAVNLQQIKNVGKATAQDIKQFAIAGIPIYQLLADTTGKSVEEVKDMEISYNLLTGALEKSAAQGGRFAGALENQSGGWNQLKSNLKDFVNLTLSDIVTATGIFGGLNDALSGVVGWLTDHQTEIVRFFTVMSNAVQGFFLTLGDANYAQEFGESLSYFIGDKGYEVANSISHLKDKAIELWNSISEFLKPEIELLKFQFERLGEDLKKSGIDWQDVINTLRTAAYVIGVVLIVGLKGLIFVLASLVAIIRVLVGVVQAISTAFSNFSDKVKTAWDNLKKLYDLYQKFKGGSVSLSDVTNTAKSLTNIPNVGNTLTSALAGSNPITAAAYGYSQMGSKTVNITQNNNVNTPLDMTKVLKNLGFELASN